METIQVTINQTGTSCTEIDYSVEACNCITCREIRERLRTFEIKYAYCACTDEGEEEKCLNDLKPPFCKKAAYFLRQETHTAEILETYPEKVGNVHGRVRIIS